MSEDKITLEFDSAASMEKWLQKHLKERMEPAVKLMNDQAILKEQKIKRLENQLKDASDLIKRIKSERDDEADWWKK